MLFRGTSSDRSLPYDRRERKRSQKTMVSARCVYPLDLGQFADNAGIYHLSVVYKMSSHVLQRCGTYGMDCKCGAVTWNVHFHGSRAVLQ